MVNNSIAFQSAGAVNKLAYNKLADFEAQVIGLFTKLVQDITETTKGTSDRSAAARNYEIFIRNAPKAIIPKLPIEPLITLVSQEAGYIGLSHVFAKEGMRAEKLLPLANVCSCDDAGTAIAMIRLLYQTGTSPTILLPALKNLAEKFADNTQGQSPNPNDISHSIVEVVTAMTYGQTVDPAVYGFLQEIDMDPKFAEHAYKVQPALQRLEQSMKQYIGALNETMQAHYDLSEPSALVLTEKPTQLLP